MLPGDLAFVFEDLAQLGQLSCVEISRDGTRARNARGVPVGTRTPVDDEDATECWLTESVEQKIAAGFGASDDQQLLAVFEPGTDIKGGDRITVVEGDDEGRSYLVDDVHGLRRPGELVTALVHSTR